MKAVGLMSGTSLDGLDIALCDITGNYTDTKVKLLAYDEKKMPNDLKAKIQRACSIDQSDSELICSLNFELGAFMGDAVNEFLNRHHYPAEEIDYIASHGQTIFHIPFDTDTCMHSTLQIGEPAEIAYRTGIQVISNFRTMDMAAGGQGAPLVPYTDFIQYRSDDVCRCLTNIGGISNVTYLPRSCREEDVFAFDTGPGNMMIDEAMRTFYGKEYDQDGLTAQSGNVNTMMLAELMDMKYLVQQPPKSTGRELFGRQFVQELIQKYSGVNNEDMVCTLTEFTAASLAQAVQTFLNPKGNCDEVIISGGGAHNTYLLSRIQERLPESKVMIQEELGYSSDAKEAVAFAVLGNETLHMHYANMVTATGAEEKVILGNITPCPRRSYE